MHIGAPLAYACQRRLWILNARKIVCNQCADSSSFEFFAVFKFGKSAKFLRVKNILNKDDI